MAPLRCAELQQDFDVLALVNIDDPFKPSVRAFTKTLGSDTDSGLRWRTPIGPLICILRWLWQDPNVMYLIDASWWR